MMNIGSKLLRIGKGLSKAGKFGAAGLTGLSVLATANSFNRALDGQSPTFGGGSAPGLPRIKKLRIPRKF